MKRNGIRPGRASVTAVAAACVTMAAGVALADHGAAHEHLGLELGGFVGAHIFSDDNELGVLDNDPNGRTPKNSVAFGMRLGWNFNKWFGVEGELALMPTKVREYDADLLVLGWRAHAIVNLIPDSPIRPFLSAGGGALTSSPSDSRTLFEDTDLLFHVGTGVKVDVCRNWGLRADFRWLLPPSSTSDSVTSDFEFLFGPYMTFGPKAAPARASAPEDSDGDKIADDLDQCPNVPEDGKGAMDGCPEVEQAPVVTDKDNDGIVDDRDACPAAAENRNGIDDEDGCPDEDQDDDGVVGSADRCPSEAEDKDGFQDEDGCPDGDNDGDGVADAADKCPEQQETRNGFQDDDGCADELPAAVSKFSGTIEGIRFKPNSDVIQKSSNPVLDGAVKVLTEYPGIRLEIAGYTDISGKRDKNIELSQKRAESVRRYFVTKGIAEDRLVAKGYGPENPVEDNTTRAGREKNRRVEFHLLSNLK
jgi:OOP family OmpA-OmpF porin